MATRELLSVEGPRPTASSSRRSPSKFPAATRVSPFRALYVANGSVPKRSGANPPMSLSNTSKSPAFPALPSPATGCWWPGVPASALSTVNWSCQPFSGPELSLSVVLRLSLHPPNVCSPSKPDIASMDGVMRS